MNTRSDDRASTIIRGLIALAAVATVLVFLVFKPKPNPKGYLYLLDPSDDLREVYRKQKLEIAKPGQGCRCALPEWSRFLHPWSLRERPEQLRAGAPIITIKDGQIDIEGHPVGSTSSLLSGNQDGLARLKDHLLTIRRNFEALQTEEPRLDGVIIQAEMRVTAGVLRQILRTCSSAGYPKNDLVTLCAGRQSILHGKCAPPDATHPSNPPDPCDYYSEVKRRVALGPRWTEVYPYQPSYRCIIQITEKGFLFSFNGIVPRDGDLPKQDDRFPYKNLLTTLREFNAKYPLDIPLRIECEDGTDVETLFAVAQLWWSTNSSFVNGAEIEIESFPGPNSPEADP